MAAKSTSLLLLLFFLFVIIIMSFSTATLRSSPSSIAVIHTLPGKRASGGAGVDTEKLQLLAEALVSHKIKSVRLTDSDQIVTGSFLNSSIHLRLTMPNSMIPVIASNKSEALHWINNHVATFYTTQRIDLISIGSDHPNLFSESLLPAIKNVREALDEVGMNSIQVSTSFSYLYLINNDFPPSTARFQASVAEPLMKPILYLLAEIDSPILVNIYPYHVFTASSFMPVGYLIFENLSYMHCHDHLTGITYKNMFERMMAALEAAILALNLESKVPEIVAETEWPNSGVGISGIGIGVDKFYSRLYASGLVRHLGRVHISVTIDVHQEYEFQFKTATVAETASIIVGDNWYTVLFWTIVRDHWYAVVFWTMVSLVLVSYFF